MSGRPEKAAARPYRSDVRAAQAAATRRRIREAGEALFLADGYVATSMDAIAEAAGVSRQTVFTAFGSKAGLLREIGDVQVVGDDLPIPLDERDVVLRLNEESDPLELLRGYAKVGSGIIQRTAPIYRIVLEGSAHDPEVAKLRETIDGLHLGGLRIFVDLLASKGLLKRGRSRARASEAVWMLNGYPAYEAAMSRGWSLKEYECWYVDCLVALLLEPDVASSTPQRRRTR